MDHQEATRLMAVEKYLLKELPPELRDEFEEHYFDCPECAADLAATEAFLSAAKAELAAPPPSRVSTASTKKSPFEFLWRPAFALPVFALLLLIIAYQNVAVYPRLASQVAQLRAPQILSSLSLVGGNSRGGEIPSVTLRRLQSFVLSLDIPTQERFSSYTCLLVSPSGSTDFRIQVSAQQARDTVSISVPAGDWKAGTYNLIVQGSTDRVPAQPVADLAHYRFAVNLEN
jgi:hypothetical protein